LEKTDDISIGALHRGDELAAADIVHVLVLPRPFVDRQCYDGLRSGNVTVDEKGGDLAMGEHEWLAERFEEQRPHLRAVAIRMLGSATDADDAVQEAWLRLSRSDSSVIDNLGGWLTTVVARVSLDMLRSRSTRRERSESLDMTDTIVPPAGGDDPEYEALLAESLGPAMLVVLGVLSPAERLAFVLHDMFAVPFEEIATILGRSPNAAKQLASRARHRVRGSDLVPSADMTSQRAVVDAFLTASRSGNFEALVALLDPAVVLRADAAGVQMGSPPEVRGAEPVAGVFSGRALAAQPALIDGTVGIVWAPGGRPKVVWDVTTVDGKIVQFDMIAAIESLDELDLVIFDQ
jgi:RNA polymerase sigma-70 factor (ECF subfamily)